jgi:hypothetical protein
MDTHTNSLKNSTPLSAEREPDIAREKWVVGSSHAIERKIKWIVGCLVDGESFLLPA